jgi:heme/copper-type cytochrome/quinol oxidase subunit 1
LIFVGAVGTLIGLLRGSSGAPVLIAGLAAVIIGTLDFTIREHLTGYRAHTAMLAAIPVALFHAVAAVVLNSIGAPRVSWVLVPLALDVPLFWLIFRPLRARFEDARRERVFELSRR